MDALKKWMILQFAPYQIHTQPNGCSPKKSFLHIILAAKWLVQHLNTSPKQLRRPLPSLLSLSVFYALYAR